MSNHTHPTVVASSRARRAARCAPASLRMVVAGLTALLLAGCGGGIDSLTGGSIPTGAITGTVVRSATPDEPLSGVEVQATLPTGEQRIVFTDAAGAFRIEGVADGDVRLHVSPAPGHGARPRDLLVAASSAEETFVAIALQSDDGAPSALSGEPFTLSPPTATLRVGDVVAFRVTPAPPDGFRPIWVVHGNIGTITPEGRFTAKRPGRGRVLALLGDRRAPARITVLRGR